MAQHNTNCTFVPCTYRSINNVLGSKITLLLGSIGYAIYIGSYLYVLLPFLPLPPSLLSFLHPTNPHPHSTINIHPTASPFVIAAGCILGVCAGLLWTAQGSLMLGYPTENEKGRFIAIFWSIFNLGGVVGASVSLGQNFHSEVGCFASVIWHWCGWAGRGGRAGQREGRDCEGAPSMCCDSTDAANLSNGYWRFHSSCACLAPPHLPLLHCCGLEWPFPARWLDWHVATDTTSDYAPNSKP